MADITREGYLFQWNLPKLPKCQTRVAVASATTRASRATTTPTAPPPSTPTDLKVHSGEFIFSSPGDDYGCGTPAKYEIATSAKPITPQNFDQADAYAKTPAPVPGGNQVVFNPTSHRRYIAYRAVDDAGNVGYSAEIDTGSGPPPGPGGRPDTKIKKLEASSRKHQVKARFVASGGAGRAVQVRVQASSPQEAGQPEEAVPPLLLALPPQAPEERPLPAQGPSDRLSRRQGCVAGQGAVPHQAPAPPPPPPNKTQLPLRWSLRDRSGGPMNLIACPFLSTRSSAMRRSSASSSPSRRVSRCPARPPS